MLPHDVRTVVDYMRTRLDQAMTVDDMVRVAGVAERTLRKHFRRFIGLSPVEWLRRMRLAAVRAELLAGARGGSVTTIAGRYRFEHLGRFAGEYRRCFGEPPSATLRRARAAALSAGPPHQDEHGRAEQHGVREMPRPALPARERPALAVLPFEATGLDGRFFAESLMEAIAVSLSRRRALVVTMASPSSRAAPDGSRRFTRDVGARYLLAGRIAQAGTQLRVIVRLVDAGSAQHLWGGSYDGLAADPFPLQDRVIAGIAGAILPSISGAEIARVRRKQAADRDAYDLTTLAMPHAFAASPDGARHALELLGRAIDMAPDDARPVGLAAWCRAQLVTYNGTGAVAAEKALALRLAERAAILDGDDDPLVITARSTVYTMMNDLETAAALVDRALARDPTSAWAWERRGWVKTYRGDADGAIGDFRRAIRLAPPRAHLALACIGIGSAHFDAGRYDAAARWKRRAMREDPATAWVNRTLAATYVRLDERAAARAALEGLRRCRPDITIGQIVRAVPFRPDFLDRVAEGLETLGLPH